MAITVTATNVLGTIERDPVGQVQIVEFTVNLTPAATHPLLPLLVEASGGQGAVVQLYDGGGVTLDTGAGVGLIIALDNAADNMRFLLGSTGATGSANRGGETGVQLIAWIAS